MSHTPGPWILENDPVVPQFMRIVGASFKVPICLHATDIEHDLREKRKADARLMAAAPELLSILKTIVTAQRRAGSAWALDGLADMAEALIAKVEGSV